MLTESEALGPAISILPGPENFGSCKTTCNRTFRSMNSKEELQPLARGKKTLRRSPPLEKKAFSEREKRNIFGEIILETKRYC